MRNPQQAKQFAEILSNNLGENLSQGQAQAFANVMDAKATGAQGPAINIFATKNFDRKNIAKELLDRIQKLNSEL